LQRMGGNQEATSHKTVTRKLMAGSEKKKERL
jgi:hypothetical protein